MRISSEIYIDARGLISRPEKEREKEKREREGEHE